MTDKLTEYKNYPPWVDTVTAEEQYQWYVYVKQVVETSLDGNETLLQAIRKYEVTHNIK
jgi:hypothetical protein